MYKHSIRTIAPFKNHMSFFAFISAVASSEEVLISRFSFCDFGSLCLKSLNNQIIIQTQIIRVIIAYISIEAEWTNSPELVLTYCMLRPRALFIKCNIIGKIILCVRKYKILKIRPKQKG